MEVFDGVEGWAEEVQRLRMELDVCKKERDEAWRAVRDAHNSHSVKFIHEANNRCEKALNDVKEKENAIKELTAAHELAVEQAESLRVELDVCIKERDEATRAEKDAQNAHQNAQQALGTEISCWLASFEKVCNEIKDKEAEASAMAKELTSYQAQLKTCHTDFAQVIAAREEAIKDAVQMERMVLVKEKASLADLLNESNSRHGKALEELTAANNRINDLDAMLVMERESSAKFLKEAHNRYETALWDIQERENVIKELSAAHERGAKQKESLSKAILQQDQSAKQIRDELHGICKEVDLMVMDLQEAELHYEQAQLKLCHNNLAHTIAGREEVREERMLVTERESSTDLLNESNKELAAAHNRIQKLTEELTAAHKRTKELTAEQSSAEMSSNNARTQLKSCQKDLAQAIASRDQSIKKLTNDIDAILAIEKESSAKFLKEANNRYEKALGDIQEKENVIKELSAAHEGLIKQKESLSKTILKQDKSLKELGKLLDDLREEVSLTSSHTLFESSTKFLKEANNRYEKALEDIQEKENVIKELKDAYESLVKQKESLSNAILQKDKSLKELGNRLDKAQFWQFL